MNDIFFEIDFDIVDLRVDPRHELLDFFTDIYMKTFTDTQEREDPAQWPGRMWGTAPEPQPLTHLLVALSLPDNIVVGGLVFEYYRRSQCGLLTYLVVEQGCREKGIGRALVDQALNVLKSDAEKSGNKLLAVFCEAKDPSISSEFQTSMNDCDRLRALLSIGARALDLTYVQPRLAGGSEPCRHLMLMTFPDFDITLKESAGIMSQEKIPNWTVYDFLYEFYQALGISNPENDENFRSMEKQLHGDIALYDPREHPVLRLKDAAVCIHFVSYPPDSPKKAFSYPDCKVFRSMELDLMSYGYQIQKLLGSKCESSEQVPVGIVFPEYLVYHSEGRRMLLLDSNRHCAVRAMISSTTFLASGIVVWHLVMVPEKNKAFNEYELIKLIHLYDGRTENTALIKKVKFRIGNQEDTPKEVFLNELPSALGIKLINQSNCKPKAGTIQIIVGEDATEEGINITEIMKVAQTARSSNDNRIYKEISRWISESDGKGKALLALCGVSTGIFDFAEIDYDEALDTLEPTFSSPGSMIRINRCTMINITEEDRIMKQVKNYIGISPYLLLPHAALLHNEALIENSESLLSDASPDQGVPLKKMEEALWRTERNLNRFYLPNVFNYITERTIFDRGADGRGTDERFNAARAKLQELENQVEAAWERRHSQGQMIIAATLAVIMVFGLRDVFFGMMKNTVLEPHSWPILCSIALMVVVLYAVYGVKR